jgi:hypothetical protein
VEGRVVAVHQCRAKFLLGQRGGLGDIRSAEKWVELLRVIAGCCERWWDG